MEEESDSHSRCPKCPSIDNDQDIADVDDIWIGCEACDVSIMYYNPLSS